MKAIILADRYEKKLNIHYPKCLIQIDGDTILNQLIKNFINCGIKDISVVVGYEYDKIKNQVVKSYYNPAWYDSPEFYSLICAKEELNDDVIVSYSGLIIKEKIIQNLKKVNGDIVIPYNSSGFCGILKISKEVCDKVKTFINHNKCDIKEVLFLISKSYGYEIKKLELKENNIYNINTASDLNKI